MKGYIYGGIALLIVILLGTGYFLYEKTLKQAGTAAVAQSINQGNTVVAQKKDEGDKITGQVNEQNTAKKETNDNATTVAVTKAETKKKVAEQTYSAGPKTPEATVTRDQAVDRADIESIWDVFCTGKPNNPQCTNEGAAK